MDEKELLEKLTDAKELSNLDRAIATLWISTSECLSALEINELFISAGYSEQNSSRLNTQLAKDKRTSKCRDGRYRINARYLSQIEEKFLKYLEAEVEIDNTKIIDELQKISPLLANGYKQVLIDIQNVTRLSWAGTAHELRQVLSSLLIIKAPDNEVTSETDYKQNPNTKGPTQKQRVRYILGQKEKGSSEKKVLEEIDTFNEALEKLIENLVRGTYTRASNAAHTFKGKEEVENLLRYFDAFIHDLLDIY